MTASRIVVFAGFAALAAGRAIAADLRAAGHSARLLDADEWRPGMAPEKGADGLAFVAARQHAEIEASYRATVPAIEVRHYGVDGKPIGDKAANAMSPAAQTQPDALNAKLDGMDAEALKAFALEHKIELPPEKGPDGEDYDFAKAARETIEKALRTVTTEAPRRARNANR